MHAGSRLKPLIIQEGKETSTSFEADPTRLPLATSMECLSESCLPAFMMRYSFDQAACGLAADRFPRGHAPIAAASASSPILRGFRANVHTRYSRPDPDRSLPLQSRIREPIVTSFGSIPARNALLIRVEDQDGAFGWGEVWANFPPSGAESKSRLLETVILPIALGRTWTSPVAAWTDLTQRMRRNAIQSGEPGPFAACIAGIEVALSDLAARKAGLIALENARPIGEALSQ